MEKILPVASFPDLTLAQVTIGRGRSLPRWEATGAIYNVSFHLADSVPQTQLEIWCAERQRLTELAKTAGRPYLLGTAKYQPLIVAVVVPKIITVLVIRKRLKTSHPTRPRVEAR